ncbi:MAG: glycosyltransferase, partial [Bacteroidia bacterium]
MAEPLISICIPTYNGEKYLEECIDSCLLQTFKNYEIIICDDGSSDKTVEIIERYKSKHPAIKFFKNPKNLGLVGNWNKCIELTSGEWIKFIFQDDSLREDCLEKFSKEIDNSVELIVCKRNFKLDKTPTEDEKDYYANRVKTLENTGYFGSTFFAPQIISRIAAHNIALNFIAEPSLTLFRKSVINKIGLFDPELKQICDLEFMLRVASNFGLKYIPEQLCLFMIHSSSTTEKNVTGKNYYTES